ncbi:MAG: type II toxin-antitoxin system VapB family antitoxin [Austwickia sp.]|nr:type II toxin-antitoxin system VapB family antitoxin [Actinomycetota bacterium]MCB1252628.1 type II toxin-antitoxin system VapB family antitoxin [Austwickia sp.]MCO5310912.1 type II toxin-antitoxin system VapB family antitoxin [Austwickia sp.]
MALSIRNKNTEAAVRRLAARTGVGLTEAIDDAVSRRLAELQAIDTDDSSEALAARRERMRRSLDKLLADKDPTLILTDDDLYDEVGLPK